MCALPVRSYPTRFYQRAHPTHIYVSHGIQILKNPPEYTMRYSVQPGRNKKMKRMLIFWEKRDSSMSFTRILPKTSHHTIYKVYFQEHNTLYLILWVTTRYSYFKRCDTFCQDCTFLEACIPRNTRDAYD